MLIKSIEAENFMKYQRLEIADLPEKGIFGLFGDNESGKSTVGEAVSFALFGATARFDDRSLTQLINWDCERCEVNLTFMLAENQQYSIMRSIDRKGDQNAALYKGKKRTQIAMGVGNVNKEIEKLTNFNFKNFRYTFYLAQKEIEVVKEIRESTHEVIHNMLGFDLLTRSCEFLREENGKGRSRKEKCENELLVTRSMVNEVKIDSSAEKNLAKQLHVLETETRQLENSLKQLDSEIVNCEQLVETREQLEKYFVALDRSFHYHFHKEKLAKTLQELSHIYAISKEEIRDLGKLTEKNQKQKKGIEQKLEKMLELENRLQSLKSKVQAYCQTLQKRLALPEKQQGIDRDNLQAKLREKEKQRAWTGKLGWVLLASCAVAFLTALISMLNVLWWGGWWLIVGLISLAVTFFLLWGVFVLRKNLKSLHGELSQVIEEIEKSQEEVEVGLNFHSQNLLQIEEACLSLRSEPIQRQMQEIKAEFCEIFSAGHELNTLRKDGERQKQMCLEQQKTFDERRTKIENLIKLIESLGKDVDFKLSPLVEYKKWLKDLDELEKKVYSLLEKVQEDQGWLQDLDMQQPPGEIDLAWQEYEHCRSKFCTLSGIPSSIGGGTGMLKRIQSMFRQKGSAKKLTELLASEKETFFSDLPATGDLKTKLKEKLEKRTGDEKKLAERTQQIEGKQVQYDKCVEELNRKKNLILKLQALNRQAQELEHNIEVNEKALTFMNQTIASVSGRFAPSISRIMSRVLPRFTKGRYQHVQVTDELVLKAFSSEKSDFVDMAELSGGTVDQLFLSLRLAFAQAVLTAKLDRNCKQFLFFDEPIISFDEERSSSFLNLLSDYNKNFVQVFVISPRSYPSELFDLVINTSLDAQELIVSGKQKKAASSSNKKASTPYKKEKDDKEPEEDGKEENEKEDDIHIEYEEY